MGRPRTPRAPASRLSILSSRARAHHTFLYLILSPTSSCLYPSPAVPIPFSSYFSTTTSSLETALSPAHTSSLLPLTEARARLHVVALLLARSKGLASAKAHLEHALLILNPLPSAPP